MITAIPTEYKGVRFRSRLEAQWAAFFDSMAWPWEYEPLDLQGYIPDFVLPFSDGKMPMLVEVKPALSMDDLRQHTTKIDASGWDHEALLVGARLFEEPCYRVPTLGLLRENVANTDGATAGSWCGATSMVCLKCGRSSFYHSLMTWFCRVNGCYDGDHYLGLDNGDIFTGAWAQAKNRVQWKGAAS